MKTQNRISILILLLMFVSGFSGYAQKGEKQQSRKKARHEKKMKSYEKVKELVSGKNFVFYAKRAFPTGYRSVDLTTNTGTIVIENDSVDADLPYFGRAYTSSYSGEAGLKFSGNIKDEKLEYRDEKFMVRYSFQVKGESDLFNVSMDISSDGNASVNINSQNRNSISYHGTIEKKSN